MKEQWEKAAEIYKYNIMDIYGDYIGSANMVDEAEKIKTEYEERTGIAAYVLANSVDYSGGAKLCL